MASHILRPDSSARITTSLNSAPVHVSDLNTVQIVIDCNTQPSLFPSIPASIAAAFITFGRLRIHSSEKFLCPHNEQLKKGAGTFGQSSTDVVEPSEVTLRPVESQLRSYSFFPDVTRNVQLLHDYCDQCVLCDANNSVRAAKQLQTISLARPYFFLVRLVSRSPINALGRGPMASLRQDLRFRKDCRNCVGGDDDLLFPTCGRLCKERPESFSAREASAVRMTLCYSSSSVE
jgi:hypothetical protein